MIIEGFILILIALKFFALINISWSTTIVVSLALIAVEIRLYLNKKALTNALLAVASATDEQIDSIKFELNRKQNKEIQSHYSDY